jgi:hypothetical protein
MNEFDLGPFLGKRIKVIARWDRFGSYVDRYTKRQVTTALVQEVFRDGERIRHHCWVQGAIVFRKCEPEKGERIEFTVRVGRHPKYVQTPTGVVPAGYADHLEFPDDIRFIDREEESKAS